MFKKTAAVLICVALIFSLASCGTPEEPKNITLLSWKDYIPSEFIKEFTQKTGIEVNVVSAVSDDEIAKMVRNEPTKYDVVVLSEYASKLLSDDNLLANINYDLIPNYSKIYDAYKTGYYDHKGEYTVPYCVGAVLIGVDTEKCPIPITSFAELLSPDLNGKVAYYGDSNVIIGISNLILEQDVNYTESLDDAGKIVQGLAKSIYGVSDEPNTFFEEENGPALGVMFSSQLGKVVAKNPNFEIVYPKEGYIYSIDVMAIPSGSEKAELACEFINYIHEPKVNAKITEKNEGSSPNFEATSFMSAKYAKNAGYNISKDHVSEGVSCEMLTEDAQSSVDYVYNRFFKKAEAGEE